MLIDEERDRLSSNEANYIYLNAGVILRLSCILPDNSVPHGDQIESLIVRKEVEHRAKR